MTSYYLISKKFYNKYKRVYAAYKGFCAATATMINEGNARLLTVDSVDASYADLIEKGRDAFLAHTQREDGVVTLIGHKRDNDGVFVWNINRLDLHTFAKNKPYVVTGELFTDAMTVDEFICTIYQIPNA